MNQTNEPEYCKQCQSFFANSAFNGMCSKCFKDSQLTLKNEPSTSNMDHFNSIKDHLSELGAIKKPENVEAKIQEKVVIIPEVVVPKEEEVKVPEKKAVKNRCYQCDKKTGIYGYPCKCDFNFCAEHRLPENHECGFDHAGFEKKRLASKLVRCVGSKF